MARKKKEAPQNEALTTYRSAVGGVGNAVTLANELDAKGYDVAYCFAVVVQDDEGKPVQGVYLLGKRRNQ